MNGPVAARLSDGRLHLQHGPIDLIVYAYGPNGLSNGALGAAAESFVDVLPGLVSELPLLRQPVGAAPSGPVARRMHGACAPFGDRTFVTPMAAVAGAVADHVLAAMVDAAPLTKAYVNNGGDIALSLTGSGYFDIAIATEHGRGVATLRLREEDRVGGVATSGWGGRSWSLGIADSVTVLAGDAAGADVAATLIANAVNIDHPSIDRAPARDLDPDSDLGDRLVTMAVGDLPIEARAAALSSGAALATSLVASGRAIAASLTLKGETRLVGDTRSLKRLEEVPA